MLRVKQRTIALFLSVLICITVFPTAALAEKGYQGREWFVSADGDDINGTGEKDKPFRTLQKGANMLEAGDTLYIRGGVYDEPFKISASGTADAPITIKNYNNETVTIRATTKLENWSMVHENVWVTDMSWNMEDNGWENMLYNGDKSLILARYPNLPTGRSRMQPELLTAEFADRTSTTTREEGIIGDDELDMPDDYWTGAKVRIHAGGNISLITQFTDT